MDGACGGHVNEFEHLSVPELEAEGYDLGYKFWYTFPDQFWKDPDHRRESPRAEEVQGLIISVRKHSWGSSVCIHLRYFRTRSLLHDLDSTDEDRQEILAEALKRLPGDVGGIDPSLPGDRWERSFRV